MLKFLFALIMTVVLTVPLTSCAQSRNVTIDGDHGKLSAVIQTPKGKFFYPMVMILHGLTGNKDATLVKNIADDLEAQGIASIRFDFNGHGESDGNFQDMTVLNELEDARHVYEYVRDMRGVTSVSIAGHSQGGVVASMLAGELGQKKIKAIALMAPAAVLRDNARAGEIFGTNYDAENPPEYVEVWEHKIGRNYIKTAQTLQIYETAEKFQGPALIVHGSADDVVHYGYGFRYHDIYKGSEIKILQGFDHGFTQDEKLTAEIVADFFARQLK